MTLSEKQRQAAHQLTHQDFRSYLTEVKDKPGYYRTKDFWQQTNAVLHDVLPAERYDAAIAMTEKDFMPQSEYGNVTPYMWALQCVPFMSANRQQEALDHLARFAPWDTEVQLRARLAAGWPLSSTDRVEGYHELQSIGQGNNGYIPAFA